MSTTIEEAKRLIRQHVQSELAQLDAQILIEHPQMDAAERLALSKQRDSALHRYAQAIESGEAWQIPKEPGYRYTGGKSASTSKPSVKSILQKYGTQRVQAIEPKADEGAVGLWRRWPSCRHRVNLMPNSADLTRSRQSRLRATSSYSCSFSIVNDGRLASRAQKCHASQASLYLLNCLDRPRHPVAIECGGAFFSSDCSL
jgi:hypothetical protein